MEPNGKIVDDMKEEEIKLEGLNVTETISYQVLPQQLESKAANILDACKWKDTQRLRDLAVSEAGLLSDEIRRQAWPLLLGANNIENNGGIEESWRSLPRHADEDQVQLDVNRAFIYYPAGELD